ncbi:putative ribosomal protein L27e [Helianthus annuus]|nr:putative ribosomal protein L27e [Helianthus annuus]
MTYKGPNNQTPPHFTQKPNGNLVIPPTLPYKITHFPHFQNPNFTGNQRRFQNPNSIKMVKFLKPNKAVVVLGGRFAGRKAVIVKQFDDGTRDRPYGHCLVAGISKYPKKVIRKDSAKKTAKKSRVKAFIKLVNYNHIMPTRYTLDVDLKDVVTVDALQSRDKKVTACKETKARFEERFKTGKNRWFFSKLRF